MDQPLHPTLDAPLDGPIVGPAPVPDADPRVGKVLDARYLLERRIGAGGMGTVYAGRHVVLGFEVAIKVLRPTHESESVQLERLKREARAASAIGNPHIVKVRDFGTAPGGETYVVMELLRGRQLFEVIHEAPMPWRRVCHVAAQIADALCAAHRHGIIHRDLKPENVLLVESEGDPDFVKVLDFGIAKLERVDKKLTAHGQLVGTPEYMSPEQCRGAELDARSDIYALGVLMYEMLTGLVPFEAEDPMELVRLQMMEAPTPPSELTPERRIPPGVEAIVLRCLEKHPVDRFQVMTHVAEALRTLIADPDAATTSAPAPRRSTVRRLNAPSPAAPSSPAPRAARGWLVGGLVAAAVAGGALFGVTLTDPPGATVETVETVEAAAPPRPLEEDTPTPGATPGPADGVTPTLDAPAPAASTRVTVIAEPPAEVFVDGASRGHTPLDLEAPAEGRIVQVELRAAGHRPRELQLSSMTGAEVRVRLEPRRVRGSATPEVGGATAGPAAAATEEVTPAASVEPEPPARGGHPSQFLDPWGEAPND